MPQLNTVLNIRLSPAQKARWSKAAGQTDLSAWIRSALDQAASKTARAAARRTSI